MVCLVIAGNTCKGMGYILKEMKAVNKLYANKPAITVMDWKLYGEILKSGTTHKVQNYPTQWAKELKYLYINVWATSHHSWGILINYHFLYCCISRQYKNLQFWRGKPSSSHADTGHWNLVWARGKVKGT